MVLSLTDAAFIIRLRITDEFKLKVSEGVSKLSLRRRKTYEEMHSQ